MSESIEIPSLENLENYRTLNALKDLVKSIHGALVTAKNALDRKTEDNKKLTEELETAKKAANDNIVDRAVLINKFEQGKKTYEKLLAETQNKDEEHKKEIKELEDKVISQEEQLEEKNSQLAEDKKKIQEMKETIKNIDEKISDCESLETEKRELEEIVATHKNTITALEMELEETKENLEKEKKNLEEETQKHALEMKKIKELVDEEKRGKTNNAIIEKQLEALRKLREEHKQCAKIIEELKNKKDTYIDLTSETRSHDKNDKNITNNAENNNLTKDNNNIENVNINHNNSLLKLNLKITEFHGKENEVVKDWIYNVENVFKASNIRDDNQKVIYAKTYLRSAALTNFKSFEAGKPNLTWEQFKEHLINKYRPLYHEETIRQKLKELKMEKTENIRSFVNKYQQLIAEIDEMSEKDKIFYFVSALLDKTRRWVNILSPQSLDQAIEIAEKYETFNFDNNETKKVFVNQKQNKNSNQHVKRSYSNQSYRNRQNYLKYKKAKGRYQNYRRNYVSYNKKSKEHNNWKQNEEQEKSENEKDEEEQKSNNKACYICGETTHLKADCPKNRKNNQNNQNKYYKKKKCFSMINPKSHIKLLRYFGKINNERVGVVFDCGGEASVISYECARRLGLNIEETSTKIEDTNGNKSDSLGLIRNIKIDVAGTEATIDLEVTNIRNVEILLGLDWFAQTKVIINPANRLLIIPSQSIICETIQDEDKDEICEEDLSDDFNIFMNEIDDEDIDEALEYNKKTSVKDIKINNELNREYQNKLMELLESYKDRFSTDIKDIGCIPNTKFVIETNNEIPIIRQPYQLPFEAQKKLKQMIEEMESAGIIRKGKAGTWASPAFIIKQKGGDRFIVDFRDLNARTKKFNHPIPLINDLFDKMHGSKIKSVLDAKKGFFHIEIDENCKHKAGFTTPFGIFEFNRVAFGLCNGPAYFSQIMHNILGDLEFVANFFDDTIIFSKNEQEHLKHLKIVFQRLRDNNITLNPEKCNLFKKEIKVLGHIITENGIMPDPDLIKAIVERKEPTNLKELQSFLGLTNVFRRFIKNYATVAAPLHSLVNKDTSYVWTHLCQKAFDELKKLITSYPVLRLPDFNKPFILKTDSSLIAKGAVLCQLDNEGREYVIAYASQLNKKHELNYSVSELECIAIVWAVNYFRKYLYQRKFRIETDHLALKWLLTLKNPNARLTRWSVLLQTFDFEVVHRAGKKLGDADALSRPVLVNIVNNKHEEIENDETFKNHDPWEYPALIHFLKFGRLPAGISKKQSKRVTKLSKLYKIENDRMFFRKHPNENFLLEIPKIEDRQEIIIRAHEIGHFKTEATFERISEKYFWKNMKNQINILISKCRNCLMFDKIGDINELARALKTTGLFHNIHIDCVFGFDETNEGYKGYLSITDKFSKWIEIYLLKSKSAEEIEHHILNWIASHGAPRSMTSDLGSEFINQIIDNLCRNNQIIKKFTSSYFPRTNGQAESSNKIITKIIQKYALENKKNWPSIIPYALIAHRSKIHSSTKYSPFEMLHGIKMSNFENWKELPNEEEESALTKRAIEIKNLIEKINPQAKINIEKSQEKQKDIQNKQLNGRIDNEIEIGTLVMIKDCRLTKPKLDPNFLGEYRVEKKTSYGNYVLSDINNKILDETFPRAKLKVIPDSKNSEITIEPKQKKNKTIVKDFKSNKPTMDKKITKNNIKAIENYQKIGKGARYLIRLKNNNVQWFPKSSIETELIKDYHSKLNKKSRKNFFGNFNFSKFLTIILLTIFLATPALANLKINDQFKLCSEQNLKTIINPNTYCKTALKIKTNPNLAQFNFIKNINDIEIMSENKYIIDDYGYQCFKIRNYKEMNQTWYFKNNEFTGSEAIQLSRVECLAMIESKRCNNNEMHCEFDKCSYKGSFKLQNYGWNQDRSDEYFDCHFNKIKLLADNTNKQLFKSSKSDCVANSLYCSLYDSIVVWNNSVIDMCGLTLIHKGFNYSIKNNYIYSKKENLLFSLKNTTNKCGLRLFQTSENLLVSFKDDPSNQIYINKINEKPSKIIQKDINNLMLAELDYDRIEIWDEIMNIHNEEKIIECSIFTNQLKIFAKLDDEFNEIKEPNGETTIVYSKNNLLFKTECDLIDEVMIIEDNNCYRDVKAMVNKNNRTKIAYLSKENILRFNSKQIECENLKRSFILPSNDKILIQSENKIAIHPIEVLIEHHLKEENHLSEVKLKHNQEITSGFDFEEIQFLSRETSEDLNNGYNLLPNDKIQSSNDLFEDLNKAKRTIYKDVDLIKSNLKNSFDLLHTLITAIVIIIILLAVGYCIKKGHKRIKDNLTIREQIELQNRFNNANKALGQC
jgi:hypothetical protein